MSATRSVTGARGWLRIILATLAAFALAYTMAPTQALAADAGGSISGVITGSDTKQGLVGITVDLYPTSGTGVMSGSTSGEGGAFTFSGLADGAYTLRAYPSSGSGSEIDYYVGAYYDGDKGTADYLQATNITISGGQAVSGLNFELQAGAVVSGVVTGSMGNISSWPSITGCTKGSNGWTWAAAASVNWPGQYKLVVPAGETRVGFQAGGWLSEYYDNAPSLSEATTLTLAVGEHANNINADLAPAPEITGTVTRDGTGVSGAYVCALESTSGSQVTCAWTGYGGSYDLTSNLAQGKSYFVRVTLDDALTTYYGSPSSVADRSTATPVTFDTEIKQTGVDIALVHGSVVTGTVTVGAEPRQGLAVCDDSEERRCNTTDANGAFRLVLPPGATKLTSTFAENEFDSTGSVDLQIVDQVDQSDVNIEIAPGTGFRGAVTRSLPTSVDVSVFKVVNGTETYVTNRWLSGSQDDFAFRSLSEGSYRVRFTADGYQSSCYGGDDCTLITVHDGQVPTLTSTDLAPLAPGGITGRVLNSDGEPIIAATVALEFGGQVQQTTTDSEGTFALADVASGVDWTLTVSKDGYADVTRSVTTGAGKSLSLGDLRLYRTATITGKVSLPDGVDPGQVRLHLSGAGWASTTVADDGTYSFPTVMPGRYRIEANTSNSKALSWSWYPGVKDEGQAPRFAVAEGSSVALDTFVISAPGTISGAVTDSSAQPIPSPAVALYDSDGNQVSTSYGTSSFSFRGLWPGDYTLRASAAQFNAGYFVDDNTSDTAAVITLEAGATMSGKNIVLKPQVGGPVSGTVVESDGTTGVPDVTLSVGGEQATSDSDGAFATDWVQAGQVDVAARIGDTWVCGWTDSHPCTSAAVTVTGDGASGVKVTLPHRGSVSGKITLPDGFSSSDGLPSIYLVDKDGHEVASDYDELGGSFSFAEVPFGTYDVTGELDGWPGFNTTVTVNGAETQDVVFSAGQSISGTVTLPVGEPEARVVLVDAETNHEVAHAELGVGVAGGNTYEFAHLASGDYYVGVYNRWYGDRQVWYPDAPTPTQASRVHLGDSAQTGVNLALPADAQSAGTISGQIFLPGGGNGDDSFDLCFYSADDRYEGCPDLTADGHYSITFPGGNYEAVIGRSEDLGTTPLEQAIEVDGDATLNFQLTAGGTLTGRLVGADGLGVQGTVWVRSGAHGIYALTDSLGFWTVSGVPAGGASITARADGFADYSSPAEFTVEVGKTLDTGKQILAQTGSLKVDLEDFSISGVEVVGVTVIVTDTNGVELARGWANGGYTELLTGLPEGAVKVRFEGSEIKSEWWRDSVSAASATPIHIVGDTTVTIRPQLEAADPGEPVGVSGTVTNNTGYAGTLTLSATEGNEENASVPIALDAEGNFSTELPPGDYIMLASLCAGLTSDWGCVGRDFWTYQSEDVAPGQAKSGINITIDAPVQAMASGAPQVTGVARVGEQLTASPGSWSPSDATFSYRWFRGETTLGTSSTYVLTGSDLGKTVSVEVTGSKAGYQTKTGVAVTRGPVAEGASPAIVPTISGTPAVGSELTAVPGDWGSTMTLSYVWKVDGVVVGTNSTTYTPTPADQGKEIAVEVTGKADGYADVTVSSSKVTVQMGTMAPGAISVTGGLAVGGTLTASVSDWPPNPDSVTYTWKRDGESITEGATYALTADDYGKTISVTVVVKVAGYVDGTATWTAGSKVGDIAFTATGSATITGGGAVGTTLTAGLAGTGWSPTPTISGVQWYRGSTPIATGAAYEVTPEDVGHELWAEVTASATGRIDTTVETDKVTGIKGTLAGTPVEITGIVQQGQTLTASFTDWAPASSYSYAWYAGGAVIQGATGKTYQVQPGDAGKALKVLVTGKADGYDDKTVPSNITSAVPYETFTVGTTTITGTAKVGKTLTVSAESWSPSDGVTFSYRWFRGGEPLGDAASYILKPSDLGETVSVEVSASRAGYAPATSSPVVSGTVAAGDLVSAKPSIVGTPRVGATLSVEKGTWTDGTEFTYSWKRGATEVGTASTYTPTVDDQGATLTVTLSGSATGYGSASLTSDASAVVAKGSLDAAKPTISGDASVGSTLTAHEGSWTADTALSYRWKRNGVVIDGATKSTYTAGAADAGAAISVVVSGAKDGYESASRESDSVTVRKLTVGAGSVSVQASSWNVGVTVTAVPSGWPAGASLSFQWKRNGVPIGGATGSTYTLQAADQGASVSVSVTGSIAGQESASSDSAASGAVQAPLKKLTKGKVSISGTAKAGKKLSAKVSKWKPSGIKYRYQWLRNGVVIGGATKSTYKVAKTDKGSKISVRVTATKGGYADIVVTSKATSKVK